MSAMLEYFCRGATAMGFFVAAGFFFRFWRRTGDRLFVFFAAAFLLLALNWVMQVLLLKGQEENSWPYLIRLLSFVTIIVAIVDKNLRRT